MVPPVIPAAFVATQKVPWRSGEWCGWYLCQ